MISYRRSDTKAFAHRLEESLRTAGHEVFIDSHLQAGERWHEAIVEFVSTADVVLALIGPTWARSGFERAQRRADDVLRQEIETALRHGVPLIPVCVDDTPMPPASEVARPFRPLLDIQVFELESDSWDVASLMARMEGLANAPRVALTASPTPAEQHSNGQDTYILELAANLAGGKLVTVLGPQSNDGPELAERL